MSRRLLGRVPPRVRTAAKLAVTVLLLGGVVYATGPATIAEALRGTDLALFGFAVVVGTVGVAISAVRWQVLLTAQGISVGFRRVLATYYAGTFLNMSLPSTVGGDVVRAHAITGAEADATGGYASIFMERLTALFVLLAFSILGLALNPLPIGWSVGYGLATGLVVATTLTVLSFDARLNGVVERLLRRLPSRAGDLAARLYGSVAAYRDARRHVLVALALSVAFQLVPIVVVAVLARAIGLAVPFAFLFLLVPVTQLILFLPISIGGYGVREAIYAALLTGVGVEAAAAVALAILVGIHRLVKNSFGAFGLLAWRST